MRVLVVADGTRGDVQPMRVLASALHDEGHAVTMAAPPGMRATVEQQGLRFAPLAMDSEAVMREMSGAIVAGPRAVLRAAPPFLVASLESQMRVLPELAKDADFILAGGLHLAIPSLAELHRIPWRWVVYSVTMLPSSWHPPMLMQTGHAPRIVNWAGWQITNWLLNRMLLEPLNAERSRLGLPELGDVAGHLGCQDPILAIDPELAPLAPDMRHLDVIGHLAPGDGDPLPEAVERFLAGGPPPLYLGFGSMTDPDAALTTRLAVEASQRAGCRLILSRGWAGLGAGRLPGHCLAVGSVSHTRLFPRMAAIVHHGGAGTTAAAARSGKPQLVIPHLADQFHFGAQVHSLGIGPRPLRRMHLTAGNFSAFSARIHELLDDEAMRERARALGLRITARPPLRHASRLLTSPTRDRRPSILPAKTISVAPGI
jgi:vancomycin aglycone glucosyltransferase